MHRTGALLAITNLCLGAPVFASSSDIELITSIDDLGYACIDEAFFVETEDSAATAFLIGGKIRLPRTCVADPCSAALSQRELAQLTGTDPNIPRFGSEWEDYYARYADYCRKETNPDGGKVAESDEDFWERTIEPAQLATALTRGSPVLPQRNRSLSPTSFAPIDFGPNLNINNFENPDLITAVTADLETEEELIGDPDSGEVLSSSETVVAVVPLPSSLMLLGIGLIGLAGLQRKRFFGG